MVGKCKKPSKKEIYDYVDDLCSQIAKDIQKPIWKQRKFGHNNKKDQRLYDAYTQRRNSIISCRTYCPDLPKLPTVESDPEYGLQTLQEWCIEAKENIESKPAEPEQNAAVAILRKIWTCLKRIPRWIYVIVLFLAALLTIFYCLGWIEPIKAFINRVLRLK